MSGPARPLLITGPARSGTTLVARMVGAHPLLEVAVDPLFPLFRSLRDAMLRHADDPMARALVDPSSPLQDYYFAPERLRALDAIQAGGLDVPFDPAEAGVLGGRLAVRAQHESPDLVDRLRMLRGATYRDLVDRALAAIRDERGAADDGWVGVKEVWIMEFVAALQRAYPDLRVLVVQRDPRAVIASNLAMGRTDPAQVGHVLSFARHWRKQEALVARYRRDPRLAEAIHVVRYERLVSRPEQTADAVCAFLGVESDPRMTDPHAYRDARGGVWTANTSFEAGGAGIRPELAERWRHTLSPTTVALVELVCGAEMHAAGYEPVTPQGGERPGPDVLADIIDADGREWSWRSDLRDPLSDFGFELARRAMIHEPGGSLPAGEIRRAFLFTEALADLQAAA